MMDTRCKHITWKLGRIRIPLQHHEHAKRSCGIHLHKDQMSSFSQLWP
uniref:Uncharacterized protein n=1 Tax=Ciona intestinalis TaxID=7719 RepID=H2XMR8_CIOIN